MKVFEFDHSNNLNYVGNNCNCAGKKIQPIRGFSTDPLAHIISLEWDRVTTPGLLSPQPVLVGQAFWWETDRLTTLDSWQPLVTCSMCIHATATPQCEVYTYELHNRSHLTYCGARIDLSLEIVRQSSSSAGKEARASADLIGCEQ